MGKEERMETLEKQMAEVLREFNDLWAEYDAICTAGKVTKWERARPWVDWETRLVFLNKAVVV